MEKLYYQNERGDRIELSPFALYHVNISKDVTGLRDVSAKVRTSSTMGQDGASYESTYIEAREITIKGNIRQRDRKKQREAQRKLNHVLNPKYRGELVYSFADVERRITCYAESAPEYKETPNWPQFTIDLICPSPFWEEMTGESIPLSEWEGYFEFPEPQGLELTDGWEIGGRSANLIVTVPNEGDVDSGMTIRFTSLGSVTNPAIRNVVTDEYMRLNIKMERGDVIEVTTQYGSKRATLYREDAAENIFRTVDSGATFLQLAVGDNLFRVEADEGLIDLDASVSYSNQYLGA